MHTDRLDDTGGQVVEAKQLGINYRTAQRIVGTAEERRQAGLLVAS